MKEVISLGVNGQTKNDDKKILVKQLQFFPRMMIITKSGIILIISTILGKTLTRKFWNH